MLKMMPSIARLCFRVWNLQRSVVGDTYTRLLTRISCSSRGADYSHDQMRREIRPELVPRIILTSR